MYRIFITKFLTEILRNKKTVSFLIWISFIVDLKVDSRVIVHFYDEIDYNETNLYSENKTTTLLSKFVKKKFNCFLHVECLGCSQFIIEDENVFPLNFHNKEKNASDDVIFINTKVIKYNDFLYFFNVVQQKSELKENFQMSDFLLVIRILDVFKFKKDRCFSRLIQRLLLSIILNGKCFNAKYNLNQKTIISSSIYKIIFREFGRIYFFDASLFVENPSWVETIEKLNERCGINYKITKNFVFINSTFITAINKHIESSKEFLIIFRIIFKKLKIVRAILDGGRNPCQNISFHIPYVLFSNIDELCFYSFNDMNFFKFMCDNLIHKNVKILTFIFCHFSSFSESFFENFKFLQCIYFIDTYLEDNVSSSKINTYLESFAYFYNGITNEKNIENFLELASDKRHEFENINPVRFFDLNKSSMVSQEFKSSKYQVFSSNRISYRSSCFELYVYVSGLQIRKDISIIFTKIYVKGLMFKNSSIHNNVKELSICNSEFSNDLLRDILLIPSLNKFEISNCNALFKNRLTYKRQSYITDFSIFGSIFENSDEMINFINCMSNLKILDLRHNKNLDMFQHRSINNKIELDFLESLVLHDREKSKGDLPNFSGLKILQKFSLYNGWYEEGSLSQLLISESLADIIDLDLSKFRIGIKDNEAMIRCFKIQNLFFFDCEFIDITFSQLFDVKKTYMIEMLILEKIVLKIVDIIFISNLIGLKYLQIQIENFFIDTKDFFKVIFLNKSQLQIELKIPKNYWREINYFYEIFRSSNLIIYEL